MIKFESSSHYTPLVEKYFPDFVATENFQAFRKFVLSQVFDNAIDIIIVLNTIVVVIQSYPALSGQKIPEDAKTVDGAIDTSWEIVETIFTILYVLEMGSKLVILGWKKYVSFARNIFDGFITVAAVLATVYVYYPNSFSDTNLIRFVVMSRVLRIARLFMSVKSFQIMGRSFVGILPAVGRVCMLLFCAVYIFSGIGMYYFGGLVTRDPDNATSYIVSNHHISSLTILTLLSSKLKYNAHSWKVPPLLTAFIGEIISMICFRV